MPMSCSFNLNWWVIQHRQEAFCWFFPSSFFGFRALVFVSALWVKRRSEIYMDTKILTLILLSWKVLIISRSYGSDILFYSYFLQWNAGENENAINSSCHRNNIAAYSSITYTINQICFLYNVHTGATNQHWIGE